MGVCVELPGVELLCDDDRDNHEDGDRDEREDTEDGDRDDHEDGDDENAREDTPTKTPTPTRTDTDTEATPELTRTISWPESPGTDTPSDGTDSSPIRERAPPTVTPTPTATPTSGVETTTPTETGPEIVTETTTKANPTPTEATKAPTVSANSVRTSSTATESSGTARTSSTTSTPTPTPVREETAISRTPETTDNSRTSETVESQPSPEQSETARTPRTTSTTISTTTRTPSTNTSADNQRDNGSSGASGDNGDNGGLPIIPILLGLGAAGAAIVIRVSRTRARERNTLGWILDRLDRIWWCLIGQYRDGDWLFANENRSQIYHMIESHPGQTASELADITDLSRSTVRYHADTLIQEDKLIDEKRFGGLRYFASGDPLSETERALYSALRNDTTARIIKAICESEGDPTASDLADDLDRSLPTISEHIDQLAADGIIAREREGQQKHIVFSNDIRNIKTEVAIERFSQ